MAFTEFQKLDKVLIAEYIRATPCLSTKFNDKFEDFQIEFVNEGYVNFVHIVKSSTGTMLIKQALPFVRQFGETFVLSRDRAEFEAKTLQIYASLSPCHVPELYYFDPCLSVIAMQYLEPPHIPLGKGLVAGVEYPLLAENISEFFAQVFFHSSRLYMSMADHKRAAADFCGNAEMNSAMEQLTSAAFGGSMQVSWTAPELDLDVKAIQEDNVCKLQIAQLKSTYSERTQALIHSDFHAGSILVTQTSVKMIDAEFAFYGPMGYDIGHFFRTLIVSFFSQDGLACPHNNRQKYKKWLLETLEETWNLFEQKFIKLWDQHKDGSSDVKVPQLDDNTELRKLIQSKYMEDIFQDALGFCAAYVIGAVIHVAEVEDFESISNVRNKAECERNALNFGKMLLKERKRFRSINQVVSSLEQYMLVNIVLNIDA